MADLVISVLIEGFMYGIMALGVFISYQILNFPDLTVDGSFPLGAAVTVALILAGVNPWIALIAAFLAGLLAGALTGLLHVRFHIPEIISGIIMMTGLYSVNYRIAGAANKPILNHVTLFKFELWSKLPEVLQAFVPLLLVILFALVAKYLLDAYLKTKSGMLLLATGSNPQLVNMLAKNPKTMKVLGLALANGLVALGGSVVCQYQRYFDVSMGTGTMVMGLAAVAIGTTIFRRAKHIRKTSMVIVGAILYKACVMIAISLGLQSSDMNLIISILFVITLVVNHHMTKRGADNA